jgi:hypothetical protein
MTTPQVPDTSAKHNLTFEVFWSPGGTGEQCRVSCTCDWNSINVTESLSRIMGAQHLGGPPPAGQMHLPPRAR